jgi:hypothetical protein
VGNNDLSGNEEKFMASKFVVMIDGEYLCSSGDGDMYTVASIKEATPLDSREEANEAGFGFTKEGGIVIEVTPDLDPIH